jgi:putative aldouronate transport system substrate-binding protein
MVARKKVSKWILLALTLSLVVSLFAGCAGSTESTEPLQEETEAASTEEVEQAEADKKAAEEEAAKAQAELDAAKEAEAAAKAEAEKAAADKAEAEKLLAEAKTAEEKAAAEKLLAQAQAQQQAAADAAQKASADKLAAEQAAAAKAAAAKAAIAAKAAADAAAAKKATTEKTTSNAGSSSASSSTAAKPSDVNYPSNVKIWAAGNINTMASLKTFAEITTYKELEKITGTKAEFIHPAGLGGPDIEQNFNLMIASGNLPDVIEHSWKMALKGPDSSIEDGIILKLNDMINLHAPNFSKYLKENPTIDKQIRTDKGSIYGFPFIRGDASLMTFHGPAFREDWLKKLNLPVPTTIDEWETVLRAFRDKDPNGNGKKDEIPFYLNYHLVRDPLYVNLVGAWGISGSFYHVNNKVKFGPIEPQFKEMLIKLNQWYKEGLIDKDFATMDQKLIDAKVTNHLLGSLFMNAGGGIGKFLGLMVNDPSFSLVGAPNPTLKKGEIPAIGSADFPFSGLTVAAITTKAKNPEQIVKWLDYAYSEQGHMLFNFGKEGLSYTMVNGYPKYTDLIMKNPSGLTLNQAMGAHFRSSFSGPFVQDKRYFEQFLAYPQQRSAVTQWTKAKNDIRIPPTTMTASENELFSKIMNDVNTYTNEMMIKFIMGAEPIDNFDKYVKTIKAFGIDTAIGFQERALERFNKR